MVPALSSLLLAGCLGASPPLPARVPPLLDVSMRLLLVTDSGTQEVVSRDDLLLPGEWKQVARTLTLSLGEGRGALVDADISWSPLDMMGETLLLRVESRATLSTALGWSSPDVGVEQRRQETVQAEPGQAHLVEIHRSADMRSRLIASFTYRPHGDGPAVPALPGSVSSLDTVVFHVRTLDGTGRGAEVLQETDVRSIGGKEVGFRFWDEEPVMVEEKKEAKESDPSGLTHRAGETDWMRRNLSDPIRVDRRTQKEKDQEVQAMRKRMEEGKLTEEDKALLEKEKAEKESVKMRVEGADLRLQPIFTGQLVLRVRLKLEARLVYPKLGKDAEVKLDRTVDYRKADLLSFDLLDLAGADPDGFPHRYVLEIKAYW